MKYLIPILFLFSSCRTVNKLFHKEKTSIDSTVVTHNVSIEEKHIDTTKTSQVTTTKENSIEIDLGNPKIDSIYFSKDTGTSGYVDADEYNKFVKSYQSISDYFVTYNRKTGKISSNQPITHVTIKGITGTISNASWTGIDSTKKKKDSTGKTYLVEKKKEVTSSVKKTVSLSTIIYWIIGLLLLLALLYLIYRYRNQIKSFVLKATTGL